MEIEKVYQNIKAEISDSLKGDTKVISVHIFGQSQG